MGNEQPSGSIEKELEEVGKFIASDAFKKKNIAFFEKHCPTFDAEEENKLEYTTIHKEYEAFVEKELKGKIGEKKLNKIKAGMADYVNETKEKQQSQEVFEAIEILSTLGDFLMFKSVMLAKKSELEATGEGKLKIIDKGIVEVDSIPEFMEKLTKLKEVVKKCISYSQLSPFLTLFSTENHETWFPLTASK